MQDVTELNRWFREPGAAVLDNAPMSVRAADYLEAEIMAGRLAPGMHLAQGDLAVMMGISRGALREGLRISAGKGLVEIVPRKGAFVRRFTAQQIDDSYAVRCALEQLAATTAIPKLESNDIAEPEYLMKVMKTSRDQGDIHEYLEANIQLHRLLFTWADNDVLTECYERLSNPLFALRLASLSLPGSLEESYTEHEDILEAVLKGDAASASERIESHMRRGANKLKKHMAEISLH